MKEKLLKDLIRCIVKEVYDDITSRDIESITDSIYSEELSYIGDLTLYIDQNKELN